MSPVRAAWEVARWEFLRFLKLREILVGMLMAFAGGATVWGLMRMADREKGRPVQVAVAGGEQLPVVTGPESRLRIRMHPAADSTALRQAVERGELAGAVVWRTDAPPALLAGERARWRGELEQVLSAAAVQARFAALGVRPQRLPVLMAPVTLDVSYTATATPPRPLGEVILTVVAIMLSVMGVFFGVTYVFISITGEKQNRVTEQVVSAISPQSWVDGKILGLSAITLVNMASLGFAYVLMGSPRGCWGSGSPRSPPRPAAPGSSPSS